MQRAGGASMEPLQEDTAQGTTIQLAPWRAGTPQHSSHPVRSAPDRGVLSGHLHGTVKVGQSCKYRRAWVMLNA
jgi:hypothetical protein